MTQKGVYVIANSIPSASNPTPTWVNITGNIFKLPYTIFGQNYDPTTDPNAITYNLANSLNSIVADWEYTIPNNPVQSQRWVSSRTFRQCQFRRVHVDR